MQIELDFYSDQVNTGRSIYPQLLAQYNDALKKLQQAVLSAQEGDGSVTSQGATRSPRYKFPAPMTTLNQRW
jgi:hypothetical protein